MTRRWGLVLGGGGLLGGAWLVGALSALEERIGQPAGSADVILGTSVGGLYAGLVAGGVATADLLAHQQGHPVDTGPLAGVAWDYDTDVVVAAPAVLGSAPGSTRIIASNVRRLRAVPSTTLMSGLMPPGRGSLARVGELLDTVVAPLTWPAHPDLRVSTVDYDTGSRVVFTGATGPEPGVAAPRPATGSRARVSPWVGGPPEVVRGVTLGAAVMASCAVPGWFPPVAVDRRRYVDGGVWSSTGVDLLCRDGLDEVFVLAPRVSFVGHRTRTVREVVDKQLRQAMTRRCMREVAAVHRTGTTVTVLGPSPDDLDAIGVDIMDASRRVAVLESSLRTSRAALSAPRPVEVGR